MNVGKRHRILVTGAGGRVGDFIIPDLQRDYDLVLTDANVPDGQQGTIAPLDLLDFDAVVESCRGIDQVIHLAIASKRMLRHLEKQEYAEEVMRVNVMGTQHVFEAAVAAGVKRVIYFSSMTVVLGEPRYRRIEHGTSPRPNGLYACTKLFGEHLANHYVRTCGISAICIRLGQPVPVPEIPYGAPRLRQSGSLSGVYCDFSDIILGVRCALSVENIEYKIFNLVSGSHDGNVDLSAGKEIGYWPCKYFTEDGLVTDNPETPGSRGFPGSS